MQPTGQLENHHTLEENSHLEETHRNIVCCVDLSDEAKKAFDFTVKNVLKAGDHLTLVHTYEPPFPTGAPSYAGYGVGVIGGIGTDNANKEVQEKHAEYLRTFGQYCREADIKDFKLILVRGEAREELVHYTEKHSVDMLIVGCRGRGAVKRTFLGSVSDYLVHHAHCPVLVVRNEKESKAAAAKEHHDPTAPVDNCAAPTHSMTPML
eukprot:Nk52_evm1s195 gene=Nk52_evmTU1s195